MRRLLSTLIACAALAIGPRAAAAQAGTAPARAASAPEDYAFPSGSGALFFHVRPDKVQDFEAVVVRLGEVLDRTADPVRHQQASSWRVFRSTEVGRDDVIYLFFFDPAVLGADYDPIKVLSEALPTDVQGLYERLRADVVRVERMGLAKLR